MACSGQFHRPHRTLGDLLAKEDVCDAQYLNILAVSFVQTLNFQVKHHQRIHLFEDLVDGVRHGRGTGLLHLIYLGLDVEEGAFVHGVVFSEFALGLAE